jgi:hypothetical protein
LNLKSIYLRSDLAAQVELNLTVEELEALQFSLDVAIDQLCDWLEEPAEPEEIPAIKMELAIMYGLDNTLERALEKTRDGR